MIGDMDDDYAYLCHECLSVFLTKTDFEVHREVSGHKTVARLRLDARINIGDKDLLLLKLA
jgi:hypothetical protein